MKTIILAGGWGSRLGQLTGTVPKPMVQIGKWPVLWHIMKIYSFYGFNEFSFWSPPGLPNAPLICLCNFFIFFSIVNNKF